MSAAPRRARHGIARDEPSAWPHEQFVLPGLAQTAPSPRHMPTRQVAHAGRRRPACALLPLRANCVGATRLRGLGAAAVARPLALPPLPFARGVRRPRWCARGAAAAVLSSRRALNALLTLLPLLFSQRARHAAWRPWGRRGRETTGPSHLPHRHATGGDRSGARGPQWPPWGTSFARHCLGGGVACARALLKEHVSDVLDGLKAVTVPRPSPPAHSRLRPSSGVVCNGADGPRSRPRAASARLAAGLALPRTTPPARIW